VQRFALAAELMEELQYGRSRQSGLVIKPWGAEFVVASSDVVIKFIIVEAGHRTSLQSHARKRETICITGGSGHIEYHLQDNVIEVVCPDRITINPGVVHRAVGPLSFIEVSTPHLDDVIRHEDDYVR
jgi:mannose-6-phosphate isomerase-like protein (cupin superfamily)